MADSRDNVIGRLGLSVLSSGARDAVIRGVSLSHIERRDEIDARNELQQQLLVAAELVAAGLRPVSVIRHVGEPRRQDSVERTLSRVNAYEQVRDPQQMREASRTLTTLAGRVGAAGSAEDVRLSENECEACKLAVTALVEANHLDLMRRQRAIPGTFEGLLPEAEFQRACNVIIGCDWEYATVTRTLETWLDLAGHLEDHDGAIIVETLARRDELAELERTLSPEWGRLLTGRLSDADASYMAKTDPIDHPFRLHDWWRRGGWWHYRTPKHLAE